jgi:hypothetical protein
MTTNDVQKYRNSAEKTPEFNLELGYTWEQFIDYLIYIFYKNQKFLAIYKKERPLQEGDDLLQDEIDPNQQEISRREKNQSIKKEVERDEKGKIKTYRDRGIESDEEEDETDPEK